MTDPNTREQQTRERKSIRCTACRAEFTEAEVQGFNACPSCGSRGVPMAIKDDVTIRINWHELRILVMWAQQWEVHCSKLDDQFIPGAIAGILKALRPQRLAGLPPLTLAEEIEELQDTYPSASLVDSEGKVIVPPLKEN